MLEIGPGIGSFACRLARRFDYTGVELDETSWRIAADRVRQSGHGRVILGDLTTLGRDERFDVVCAFEVLEHMENDVEALVQWASWLKPGGILLISVPAFESRFGASDLRVGHYRRYEPEQLRTKIQSAGLRVVELRVYGAPLGLGLERAWNLIARLRPSQGTFVSRTASSGRAFQPPQALGWLTRGLSAPFRRLQAPFVNSRIGIGLVALAIRPK